jgi:hypothetical protein
MIFMTKHGWKCLAFLTAIVIGGAIVVSGCGDDDDDGGTGPGQGFVITDDQAGRWRITISFEDAEGQPLEGFDDQTTTETLCPGVDYAQDEYGDCDIDVLSSTSFRAQCSETTALPGMDCTIVITLDLTFVFEEEDFTATGPVSLSATGEDCEEEFEINGTANVVGERIGPVPPGDCGKSAGTTLTRLVPDCVWSY